MSEVLYHRGEADDRPWGRWEVLDTGPGFCVKRLTVQPGGKLSLQLHHHRAEHWVIVAGTAHVTRGEEVLELGQDAHVYLPLGIKHRIENRGTVPVEFIEVQTGDRLDENDIVRFDDNYGRP
jgi:mannose-6-phosphate isomerase-like protein (cupin superfamily)